MNKNRLVTSPPVPDSSEMKPKSAREMAQEMRKANPEKIELKLRTVKSSADFTRFSWED